MLKLAQWLFNVFLMFASPFMRPDYLIYTHRKGWMHITKATPRDRKEMSGLMCCMPVLE